MQTRVATGLMALCLGISIEALGHHSFNFFRSDEGDRFVVARGTIAEVRLVNPHSGVFIDVATDNGGILQWGLETRPAVHLLRRGWTNDTLRVGQQVTFAGERLREENRAWWRAMLVPGPSPGDDFRLYIEVEALDPPERAEYGTRFERFPACDDVAEYCYRLSADALHELREAYGGSAFLIPVSATE